MNNLVQLENKEKRLTLQQFEYLLDCVKTFEVSLDNGKSYANLISDLEIEDNIAQDTILLHEEGVYLKTDTKKKLGVTVSEDFNGYEVTGKNFYMSLYDE